MSRTAKKRTRRRKIYLAFRGLAYDIGAIACTINAVRAVAVPDYTGFGACMVAAALLVLVSELVSQGDE